MSDSQTKIGEIVSVSGNVISVQLADSIKSNMPIINGDVLLFNRGFYRFSDDTPTFSCFLIFTQDHTNVLLFNRGFSRFSDETPTFSCFLAFTQDNTDVLLFNRGF